MIFHLHSLAIERHVSFAAIKKKFHFIAIGFYNTLASHCRRSAYNQRALQSSQNREATMEFRRKDFDPVGPLNGIRVLDMTGWSPATCQPFNSLILARK